MSDSDELSTPDRNANVVDIDDITMQCDDDSDKNVSSDMEQDAEDPYPDDNEFFILSKEDGDEEDPKDDSVDDEKDIATFDKDDSLAGSVGDRDNNVCSDVKQESICQTKTERPKIMDMYVNTNSARRKTAFYRTKVKRIESLLSKDPIDVAELRQQAISRGGLLNAELRRRVWPILVNVSPDQITPKPDQEVLESNRYYTQAKLDVDRSVKRFPPGMEEQDRKSQQGTLMDIIIRVLIEHPELHYYQGFNDICVTFLLVMEEDLAFAVVEKLSMSHLREFMEPTMERTQQIMDYLPCLLQKANPELQEYLERAELGTTFCISWLLTWFGYVVNDIDSILRLFDFFIACHPLMPIYVSVAVVLLREKEIFATEQEMSALFQLLTRIPDNLPVEELLSIAGDLFLQYPPKEVANEALQRFKRAQEQAAARRAQALARSRMKHRSSLLPDGNVTFGRVTFWMLGAVVSVAAYALINSLEWDWGFSL